MIKKKIKKLYNFLFENKKQIKERKSYSFFTKDHLKGLGFNIGDYTYGNPTILFNDGQASLEIGKFCSIAQNVKIYLGGNHRSDWVSTYPFNVLKDYFPDSQNIKGHPATKGNVVIGNDVWIGDDVTILSGVKIGNGAIIGARSVISKDVGSYEIWVGNPAKLIKTRFTQHEIAELEKISWWDWDIDKIKKQTEILCSSSIVNLINNEKQAKEYKE